MTQMTITADSRQLGIFLPTVILEGLSAQQAEERLTDYRRTYPNRLPHGWHGILTYRGLIVAQWRGRPLDRLDRVHLLLCEIQQKQAIEVSLHTPISPPAPRGLAGVLKHLTISGLGGVHASNGWHMAWERDSDLNHPWDIAFAHIVHNAAPYLEGPTMPGRTFTHPEDVRIGQLNHLFGEDTLSNQLQSLGLFSVETGHLLHRHIYVTGRAAIDRSRGTAIINTWDLGLSGYNVEEHPTDDSDIRAYVLRHATGPEEISTEATVTIDLRSTTE